LNSDCVALKGYLCTKLWWNYLAAVASHSCTFNLCLAFIEVEIVEEWFEPRVKWEKEI